MAPLFTTVITSPLAAPSMVNAAGKEVAGAEDHITAPLSIVTVISINPGLEYPGQELKPTYALYCVPERLMFKATRGIVTVAP
jgi:hypothetical protein